MKLRLPTVVRMQCPSCGVPVDVVDTQEPWRGVIRLLPCEHETTPGEVERAWRMPGVDGE